MNTSWLVASNGRIYSVADAPAALTYTGIYTGDPVREAKWGISTTYASPVVGASHTWAAAYTVGRDAGSLILSTPTAVIEGAIHAGVITGAQQTAARPAGVTDPFTLAQNVAPLGGTLVLGSYSPTGLTGGFATDVVLGSSAAGIAAELTAGQAVAAARSDTAWFSADLLNQAGLSSLQVVTASVLTVAAPLSLAPGGQVTLTAPDITVAANLVAPDATVTLGNCFGDCIARANAYTFLRNGSTAAVTLAAGVSIDVSGMWNNRLLDSADATGAAFIAGGSVRLDSSQAVTLAAGSAVDVSAGGTLSTTGAWQGGKGGSVTLIADDPGGGSGGAPLRLAGTLEGFGASGGGTLTITAPFVQIGAAAASATTLRLDPSLFASGFSSYVIDGLAGLEVTAGTVLDVVAPSYTLAANANSVPTGADPTLAYTLALAPLFTPNSQHATLTQRGGASLSLQAVDGQQGGAVTIGSGAAITVDPGRSVALTAYNSVIIDGSVTAHGGSISIVNTRYQDGTNAELPSLYVAGLAIWLGASSRLDVSGIAQTALDNRGRPFGLVQNGGTISIGGIGGTAGDGTLETTDAQIVIRPGAVLDASGAEASIDPSAGQDAPGGSAGTVAVAGSGGGISLSSYNGIFMDGTLQAAAGGAGAAGGTLSLTLETPIYNISAGVPGSFLLVPRVLTVAQTRPCTSGGQQNCFASLLPATLQEGQATPQSAFGQAWIGADQITKAGFGTVNLSSRGLILFEGNVNLAAAQSITLANGILADSSGQAHAQITAPYVRLGGDTSVAPATGDVSGLITQTWTPPRIYGSSYLLVKADQIDVINDVRLGVCLTNCNSGINPALSTGYAAFAQTTLSSQGDLRFLAAAGSISGQTTLFSSGDITLKAAQIYPASGARATVVAGYDFNAGDGSNPLESTGLLEIDRNSATTLPATPLSVGGNLTLAAGEVDQNGVVVAPLGNISLGAAITSSALVGFGAAAEAVTSRVVLGANSVTSVSAAGLTIPYGGTSDGVTYNYAEVAVGTFSPGITLAGRSISGAAGSVLDLRGGGTLTGGGGEVLSGSTLVSQGFIAGQGGSTDILVTPLLQFNPASTAAPAATLASDPVYAIVAGYQGSYAPVTPLDRSSGYYGSLPAIGQQITIGSGVPGLPAGTYTLLPSYYALLPGGYRVQLAPGHLDQSGAVAAGYGTWEVAATPGIANTNVQAALAVPAYITPASAVRDYSQYDEQSYSAYEIALAATYDRSRPLLPQDAGTLTLLYPPAPVHNGALEFDGTALFSPGTNGYGGTLVVSAGLTSAIEVTGPSGATSTDTVAVSAAALDQFDATRIVIGGSVTYTPGAANAATQPAIVLNAAAGSVTVDAGAKLTAADVFLLASDDSSTGAITLASGAVIDTIGHGAPAYDSASTGLAYNVQRSTAVLVSNGQITLAPLNIVGRSNSGPLTIANGATILSSGSIVTSTEATVLIGAGATFGTAELTLLVPVVSIGTPAAGVPVPPGLALTPAVLAGLLNGDPATGVPALRSLQITASGAVDIYGTVDFGTGTGTGTSGLQQLTLNTPAIYGQGGSGDVAQLVANTLVWNGVAASGTTPSSVLPQGVVAGGAGTGTGTLEIETSKLVLGYPNGVAPTQSVSLDRTILGFSQVTLSASSSISFNNTGTLSVYAQQSGVGFTGTGGALTLATPVLTGASGASLSISAGGSVTLAPSAGGAPSAAAQSGQGATLAITAGSVSVGTTVALNAGSISLTATTGDITLGAGSRLDASGPTVTLIDQIEGSPGGTVALESTSGNVVQAAGGLIDVSASDAAAGTLSVTATAGEVALDGTLRGSGNSNPDGGSFSLRAGSLQGGTQAGFTALNAALAAGKFTAARSFDIGTGDLDVTGTIQAHSVSIATSGGSLTVSGTINASGAAPGSIALAAADALTLTPGAVLDAHATVAQTDSTGAAIPAANRADVSLAAITGKLTLAGGATIDVRNASGTNEGTVELYAPRETSSSAAAAGGGQDDVAIDASAAPVIRGAASIALYAMRDYVPAGGVVTQATLNAADADNTAFIAAALANPGLLGRLAGLSDLASFHLRPGVALVSSGALTVDGDLNLNNMRYTSLSGVAATEPGVLLLRAGGTLSVYGSISDGFATPVDPASAPNPDDKGWVLLSGSKSLLGQSVVVPTPVALAAGTKISTDAGTALSYPITLTGGTLKPDVLIPVPVTLIGVYRIPAGGWVATSTIRDLAGNVLFPKGALLPAGTRLDGSREPGIVLDAGAVLPLAVHIASGTVWPAGATLMVFKDTAVTLVASTTVPIGGEIPAGSDLVFPPVIEKGHSHAVKSVLLRAPGAGTEGTVFATAPLDASGQSWSIQLVGGANLASANTAAVQPASVLAAAGTGGNIVLSDLHYVNPSQVPRDVTPGLSVIRTGTGDLSLRAGGNIVEASLYGIYTAGTQSAGVTTTYELPLGSGIGTGGTTLSTSGTGTYDYNTLLSGYQAWYPTGGGNVVVSAQGNITGNVVSLVSQGNTYYVSDAVGNWLWRQGQGSSLGQPAAWWINFGNYVDSTDGNNTLLLVGFSGIGALGGGNVTVTAGGDAGHINTDVASVYDTTALDVVVASTGRVAANGSGIAITGGGNVMVSVGGSLNPATVTYAQSGADMLYGVIGNMRGTVTVDAGAIGQVVPTTALQSVGPIVQPLDSAYGGPLLLLGDATASLTTRGDLVLAGVIDPTRVPTANTTPWTANDPAAPWTATTDGLTREPGGGEAYFSLWTSTTAVSLASAGGTLVPSLDVTDPNVGADMNITYPPILRVVATTGSIIYGGNSSSSVAAPALELAPSPVGQLQLLAGGSIDAGGLASQGTLAIDISGAPDGPHDLPSPYRPAFSGTYEPFPNFTQSVSNVTDTLDYVGASSLFAFTADTPTSVLHGSDTTSDGAHTIPALIYAAGGDIIDLGFGEIWRFESGNNATATWYIAAKPALIEASQDIISAGAAGLEPVQSASGFTLVTRNLIVNDRPGDVSVISAGRDIFYANFDIAGPGTLKVSAGRNLYQADQGSLYSLGQIVGTSSSQTGGASILLMAGLAQNPPDWSSFQSLYLGTSGTSSAGDITFVSPSVAGASQTTLTYQPAGAGAGALLTVIADTAAAAPSTISGTVKRNPPSTSLASACVSGLITCDNHSLPVAPFTTVARGYDDALLTWMEANAGFVPPSLPAGLSASEAAQVTAARALAAFAALPLYQRIPFLMNVYYSELAASGLEQTGSLLASDPRYTATSAARHGSLARGQEAQAALEPDPLVASPATTSNAITLYGPSGVTTAFGGDISAFAPGGQLVLGLASQAPPTPAANQPAAGLITFGSGDIDIATYGSVLLGDSRIFTTFGGAITIWSEGSDIDAGNGSKTTSVYQPPRIDYDNYGDITLSPSNATSGAGIATIASVAGVPPGDLVLVVEIGVINTGEAGIRSSGRVSLTGTVIGNGGVTAAGGTFGLPVVAAPNVGALAAAAGSSAAAGSTGPCGPTQPGCGPTAGSQLMPSLITVEVVSFGGDTFE